MNCLINFFLFIFLVALSHYQADAQDTATYKLRLSISLLDLPQYKNLPHRFPSMQQSLELSNNFYDVGYLGISALGNKLVNPAKKPALNKATNYLLSLGFVKYGSELPIPLGVWAHEEFHRAILGNNNITAQNGNWLFTRWDGTVFGVSDEQLTYLKQHNLKELLYAYTAGVHAENLSTYTNLVNDFYHHRSFYKNALYLYNAYYIWNYLNFASSPATDDIKTGATPYENKNPVQRDFAGSDLTTWAYDMFKPDEAYTERDDFPEGQGENRRIGFSDLPVEGQEYLKDQKKLALLNFVNPAIFFINRININPNTSFTFFAQYNPTHFGNHVALQVPVRYKKHNIMAGLHRYSTKNQTFNGYSAGILDQKLGISSKLSYSLKLHVWEQPKNQDFRDTSGKLGGSAEINLNYQLNRNLALSTSINSKTEGWALGNPYLKDNVSFRLGLKYQVTQD